jgi:hypothetical protein
MGLDSDGNKHKIGFKNILIGLTIAHRCTGSKLPHLVPRRKTYTIADNGRSKISHCLAHNGDSTTFGGNGRKL